MISAQMISIGRSRFLSGAQLDRSYSINAANESNIHVLSKRVVQDEKVARESADARVAALECDLEAAKSLAAKQSAAEVDAMAAERDSLRAQVCPLARSSARDPLYPPNPNALNPNPIRRGAT